MRKVRWIFGEGFVSLSKQAAFVLLSLIVFVSVLGAGLRPACAAQAAASPSSVTIGFIPGENPETLKENGLEMAKLIQARIGVPVNIYISKDYSGLIEAMKTKKVDFAFFSALTFVAAEKDAGAKVLLKKVWKSPYYYSMVLASGSSGASKLTQLKGKKFAYVDEKSASGYLYPRVYFKKQGVDPATYFSETIFSGNHEASVRLLRDGKVDAVAVFSNDKSGADSAWTQFAGAGAKKPKVIWTSEPIPNDPFCVRKDFYESHPKLAHDLMFAMIELQEDPKEGSRFRKVLGASSLVLATSQQYEPVREMVKELDLKLQ